MEVFIKVAPEQFRRLRSQIGNGSPVQEAINKATRIDYSLEGVLFEGYNIPCNEEQARAILEIAKQTCPELIAEITRAIRLARPG